MQISLEMLTDMRKATLLTGQLSQVQVNSLRMYPMIYFNDVKRSTMRYDIVVDPAATANGKQSEIRYEVEFKEEGQPTHLDKYLTALKSSVHLILWPEVRVVVEDVTNKKTYE